MLLLGTTLNSHGNNHVEPAALKLLTHLQRDDAKKPRRVAHRGLISATVFSGVPGCGANVPQFVTRPARDHHHTISASVP